MPKKKILVVSLKYPPKYSGYGNQMHLLADKILACSDSYSFTVLTGNYSNTKRDQSIDHEIIPIGLQKLFDFSEMLGSIVFGLGVLFWIIFRSKKYFVIHCIGAHGPSAIPSIFAGFIKRKKVIIKVTQAEFRDTIKKIGFLHKWIRNIRMKIVKQADLFVVISTQIRNDLLLHNINPEKIIDIPNGVDNHIHHSVSPVTKNILRDKLDLQPDNLVILYVASLIRRKGIIDFIDALKMIDNEVNRDTVVMLCGPDHENIYDSHIKNNFQYLDIRYMGSVEEISRYYQASDIFVLPSYSEGLPNVLLEAAMSGLAVIGSDIGGNNDIISDKINGLLFEPGNVNALKNCIILLKHDAVKRTELATKLQIDSMNKYSLSVVAEKYILLYDKLVC